MADAQIVAGGTSAAPLAYTVPGAQEIILRSLYAELNGASAAVPYYPCIRILAPGGKVVGEYVTDQSVAAGASVDVSWFPGVAGAPASLSNPGLMAVRVNLVGDLTVNQGDPGTVVTWGEAAFDTGTPTPFWSAGSPTLLTAPVTGLYFSAPNPIWNVFSSGIAVDAEVAFYVYYGGQTPDGTHALSKESESPQGATHYTFSGQHHALLPLNAGDTIKINAYFNQGTTAVASLDLMDLRTHGTTYLTTSWSLVLVATT